MNLTLVQFLEIDKYSNLKFKIKRTQKDEFKLMTKLQTVISQKYTTANNPIYTAQSGDLLIKFYKVNNFKFVENGLYNFEFKTVEKEAEKANKKKYIVLKITNTPEFVELAESNEKDVALI